MCSGLIVASVLSFADDQQGASSPSSPGERANEKATFDHSQGVYNDKANKDIRAKNLVEKKIENNEQNNKKVQDEQDVNKGQVILKF